MSDSQHDGLPKTPGPLYGMMALLAGGIASSMYLVQHKLHMILDPDYESSCNASATISCDKVNTSGASELFGVPISLLGIPTYMVLIYLVWQASRAISATSGEARQRGRLSLEIATALGFLTVLYSAFLFYYSKSVVGAVCPFCMSLYAVNFITTGGTYWYGPRNLGQAFSSSLKALADLVQPVQGAAATLLMGVGLCFLGYTEIRTDMEDAYKARIDKQVAETYAEPATAVAKPNPNAGGRKDGKLILADPGSSSCEVLADPKAAVRKGESTKDGWPYFETPLNEPCEFWLGNPDAKVTVVKYADFQCAYCKYLAESLKPVEEKYKDRVRFVMKNFPMNIKCNRVMEGYDKHPYACESAVAGVCAGKQGKFWEMHDVLYANQEKLSDAELRGYAQQLNLDLAKYDACVADPKTMAHIKNDIEIALRDGINGTPRTFINHRMVTGSASPSILEYHIQLALKAAESGQDPSAAAAAPMAPKPDGSQMVSAKTAKGEFWIDPYEASITKDGKAASIPGVPPAESNWHEAKEACEKAGKRLCTEEEWVGACAGQPAVDNNNNRFVADDDVEGNMYPYGAFYEANVCNDQADKYDGKAVRTGSKEKCRTPSGIFDLGGNVSEWVESEEAKASLMGGSMSAGESARCNQRSPSQGTGRKNFTIGFRCCADSNVKSSPVAATALKENAKVAVGMPVPAFDSQDSTGAAIRTSDFKGKVTLINFFASWCAPCKKEMPYLIKHAKDYGAKGFQVVSIGGDTQPETSVNFAKEQGVPWNIIADPESKLAGMFSVYSMPATFIIDRAGNIAYVDTGFKPEEQAAPLQAAIERLTK